jgi:glycosyltransferase involved in cell wall biosynthesis
MFSPLAKLFGIKVILTFHSANYEHKKWGKFAKLLLKGSEKIALSQADKVIFVNKFQLQKSPKKYNTKYIYIPNGIPKVSFPKNVNFIQSLKLESKKYILAVGRITPEKGFDLLIKAFSQINTDYKLVIAGGVETETGYLKKLQDMIPPLRIVFTGYTTGDNLKQLYSNAALFVLPSRNEGFPIVLLEAMAYQLDVLVSDIPATHLVDLQKKDYFKLDDENSLIKGISDKLQNITSRKYDLTNFNWDKIALKVYDIYHNI